MFSYIYADQGGMRVMQVAKTKELIERVALDNIKQMIEESGFDLSNVDLKTNPELQKLTDALKTKDANQAIKAWGIAGINKSKTISIHKIVPVSIVQ